MAGIRFTAFILFLGGTGCSCGGTAGHDDGPNTEGCSDQDGDGFGVGPDCQGPDCNDFVDTIHEQKQCDGWCDEHEFGPGCPCASAEPETCHLGDPGTLGVGPCRAGITTCRETESGERLWGPCESQVVPVDESCDEVDNDCDGTVDELFGGASIQDGFVLEIEVVLETRSEAVPVLKSVEVLRACDDFVK